MMNKQTYNFVAKRISCLELAGRMERARKEWKRLEAEGTPYWCVHKDRSVSHPAAYWQDDQSDGIHRKHGVMCRDCGGYIQEG